MTIPPSGAVRRGGQTSKRSPAADNSGDAGTAPSRHAGAKVGERERLEIGDEMRTGNRKDRRAKAGADTGIPTPEIVLPAGPAHTWGLRDFRGRPVILVFYPADWEPVSSDQLAQYNDIVPQLRALDAELVGISVDAIWCHQAFAKMLRLRFLLLSDAYPRGAAARAYGVYRPRDGTSERALVVIDRTGIIRWRYVAPRDINPGIDGMLTVLEALAAAEESA
jgi:peroxiredoxin